MRLSDQLAEGRILINLKARSKEEALREVAKLFAKGADKIDATLAHAALAEREEVAQTGIGDGLALPHGKISGPRKPVYALAIAPEGVEWAAADGRPVRIVAAVLAPESSAADPVKLLARLARVFRDEDVRTRLLAARSPAQVLETLRSGDSAT